MTTEIRNGFVVTHQGSTEIHTDTTAIPKHTLYTDVAVPRGFWATLDLYTHQTPQSTGARFWEYTLHFYDDNGQERGMPACGSYWATEERAFAYGVGLFERVAASLAACAIA